MKRFILAVLSLFLAISLSACQTNEPIENPEPELFSVLHEDENFTLLIRTYIDPDQLYTKEGIGIKSPKGVYCLVGSYEMVNYMVQYKGEYYDIVSGATMNLFTTSDLTEWGINVNCFIEE